MIKIFKNRIQLFESFDKHLNISELGVFEGDFSKEIFKICEPNKLYLVDLFEGYFGSGDKDGKNHHFAQLEDELIKLKDFFYKNDNVEIYKQSTTEFLNNIENDLIDIIYIDADHNYDSVKSDLYMSLSKIRMNGLICGHDYVNGTDAKRAVDDFCLDTGLSIKYLTEDGCPSFCIEKIKL